MHDADVQLVERSRRGDRAAFGALYDRHARLVRAICFDATGDAAAAEDLAQDVFLRAYQRLDQLREADRFLPWLCEIARRAGCDWRRRLPRNPSNRLESEFVAPTNPEHDRLEALRLAIRELPQRERTALHLFYLEEQPAESARQALGLSPAGFYKLLDRARRRLAAIMTRSEEACR